MILLPVIILAIIQGITEFLPISSSGHLVLVHHLFDGIDTMSDLDQKRLDIAVHIGTLLAVILYFHKDFIELIKGGIDILSMNHQSELAKKSFWIIISSLPVIIVGMAIFMIDITIFDGLLVIACTSIMFGILLYVADKKPERNVEIRDLSLKSALFYGFAQCIALIPGVSRSGITMTAGRYLGHSRTDSARISLLMGMVTIAAAGTLTGLDVFQAGDINTAFFKIAGIGIILSFITAYISILCMMKWFAHKGGSMTPFVIYRIALGFILLGILYI